MISLFVTILNMSITASIVALAVILVRILLKKVPKVFSYALWSVVLFRLLFPFSIESVLRLMLTFTNTRAENVEMTFLQGEPFLDIPLLVATQHAILEVENGINFSYTFFQVASFLWLTGFVSMSLYGIIGYVRLKRRVYFATRVRDNIFETDNIKTPFVLGFFRPKIYFPTSVDPLQHDHILKHEQAHIKRCDHLIKPFAYVALALHWFNPLIWLSYILMSKDMEMSCDEAVLRNVKDDMRKDYAISLLQLSTCKNSLLSPIAFGESNVKERVMNVLKFKKSKKWIITVSIIAVCAFVISFASNLTTLAMVNEPDSGTMTMDERMIEDTFSISEFEEIVEMLRNTPAIFQTDELLAMFEELLAESIREERDYVTVDIEDLMALEGAFSINTNDLGFDLEDFHLFDINANGFDLEDFRLFDINANGFGLEDVRMLDTNTLDFNDFLGMTREEALTHAREQLVENGHMTREQADRLESLPMEWTRPVR